MAGKECSAQSNNGNRKQAIDFKTKLSRRSFLSFAWYDHV